MFGNTKREKTVHRVGSSTVTPPPVWKASRNREGAGGNIGSLATWGLQEHVSIWLFIHWPV